MRILQQGDDDTEVGGGGSKGPSETMFENSELGSSQDLSGVGPFIAVSLFLWYHFRSFQAFVLCSIIYSCSGAG